MKEHSRESRTKEINHSTEILPEFRIKSGSEELNDYLIDIIYHRQKVTVVKKLIYPSGGVETTCQIATSKKRPRRSKKDTADLHAKIKIMYESGLKKSEIANKIGCSRAYVTQILKTKF